MTATVPYTCEVVMLPIELEAPPPPPVVVTDPCLDLTFTPTEAYTDHSYKAGDPPLVVQEQLQSLEPQEIAAQCPQFNRTISQTVVSGTIESDWVHIDEETNQIIFWAPASFEGSTVESAVIRFEMVYLVGSSAGVVYANITKSFVINLEESDTGFCYPEGFGLPPTIINVEKYLGDDPSRLVIASKSRNVNCTDTTFRVESSNGTEVDSSIFRLEISETPHQALLDVYAD